MPRFTVSGFHKKFVVSGGGKDQSSKGVHFQHLFMVILMYEFRPAHLARNFFTGKAGKLAQLVVRERYRGIFFDNRHRGAGIFEYGTVYFF